MESQKAEIEAVGASLAYMAAEKRFGVFKPEKWLRENPIAFPFLLDEDRAVTKAFGVYHRIGLDAYRIAHPATFVIGRDGVVRYIYVGSEQTDMAPFDQVLAAAKTG